MVQPKLTSWEQRNLHTPGCSGGAGRGFPRPCPGLHRESGPSRGGKEEATSLPRKRVGGVNRGLPALRPGWGRAHPPGPHPGPAPCVTASPGASPRQALQVTVAAAARGGRQRTPTGQWAGARRGGSVPAAPAPRPVMSQSRRAPAFPGRLRLRAPGCEAAIEAGRWLLSHGLPLAPPLPLPLPRRAPPRGLASARRLRGGGAAGNGCAPFGSPAVLALLPEEAGALPAVLMGHGGEGCGRRGLPGTAGPPEGRRRPVLRHIRGPGRHPPRRPAPHPGAAATLEAPASSDQGSRAGAGQGMGPRRGWNGDAWTCVRASFRVSVPGVRGCCPEEG